MNVETKRKLNVLSMNEFTNAVEIQEKNPSNYLQLSFDERFAMIVDHVYQEKYNEKIRRRIKQAKLRYPSAALDIIDYQARNLNAAFVKDLGTLEFINTCTNICAQGFTGSGKTFLACAIAKAACQQDIKTLYIRMPDLIQLKDEHKMTTGAVKKLTAKLASYKLLVIDEWLLNVPSEDDIKFLFELFELKYNNSSTIFATQYKKEEWHERLGGGVYADAIMDRLVHNLLVIESGNVNMRERIDSQKLTK